MATIVDGRAAAAIADLRAQPAADAVAGTRMIGHYFAPRLRAADRDRFCGAATP
jgi:hypothetical protein